MNNIRDEQYTLSHKRPKTARSFNPFTSVHLPRICNAVHMMFFPCDLHYYNLYSSHKGKNIVGV
jgi:hypothetical protein